VRLALTLELVLVFAIDSMESPSLTHWFGELGVDDIALSSVLRLGKYRACKPVECSPTTLKHTHISKLTK